MQEQLTPLQQSTDSSDINRPSQIVSKKRTKKTAGTASRSLSKSNPPAVRAAYPIDLPSYLAATVDIFEGINLVVSLNPTHAFTFHAVQATVSTLLARTVSLDDLAAVKAIAQDLLVLEWTPRSSLDDGSTLELRRAAGLIDPTNLNNHSDAVLTIAFSDKPLSRNTVMTKPQRTVEATRRKMMIRSAAFCALLVSFCKAATKKNTDPVAALQEAKQTALPPNPYQSSAIQLSSTTVGALSGPSELGLDPVNDMLEPSRAINTANLICNIKTEWFYRGQIAPTHDFMSSPRHAEYGILPIDMAQSKTWGAVQDFMGIQQCYLHQTQALQAINDKHHLILSSSTSSGKSLVYQLAVLCSLEYSPASCALLIFPTKALAQDQKRSLGELIHHMPHLDGVNMDTFDGDTSAQPSVRRQLRNTLQIALTNPDTLHAAILPHHALWKRFLAHLRYVVVDEMHYYLGKMGVHMALVLRRLLRLCQVYGNESVQFIGCSATISDPIEYMHSLCGVHDIVVVAQDTSSKGIQHQIIWNPPYKVETTPSLGKLSLLDQTAKVLAYCLMKRVRTICFTKTRNTCELVLRETTAMVLTADPELAGCVMAYRGGYNPVDRRQIESKLFKGELLGIVATNALELGIDIGCLDVVIHCGFPFTIASYRQQLGRAGRRGRDSLSIMMADEATPLDQYMLANPCELFDLPIYAPIVLNLTNEEILESHLQCAAAEMPLRLVNDATWFACRNEDATQHDTIVRLRVLCDAHLRFDSVQDAYICNAKYNACPSSAVSLRGMPLDHEDDKAFRLIDINTMSVVEVVDVARVPYTLYVDAVFLHQGIAFLVTDVDMTRRVAQIRRAPPHVDYITVCRGYIDIDPLATVDAVALPVAVGTPRCEFGQMRVATVVFGYLKVNPRTKAIIEMVESSTEPKPHVHHVHGVWIDIPLETVMKVQAIGVDVQHSIHGVSHLLQSLVSLFVASAVNDLNTIAPECKTPLAKRVRSARVVLYDTSGQAALVRRLLKSMPLLVKRACRVLSACECEAGCDACVYMLTCQYQNLAINKRGACVILKDLAGDM
ncbi:hypothetical protein BASA83_011193 [Batrachochytrium salamandrivorans]|nr:hypothetical protein BASA83_011193 [Batrachochytrium salamandrivorans]